LTSSRGGTFLQLRHLFRGLCRSRGYERENEGYLGALLRVWKSYVALLLHTYHTSS
jgi:hypothetical protein